VRWRRLPLQRNRSRSTAVDLPEDVLTKSTWPGFGKPADEQEENANMAVPSIFRTSTPFFATGSDPWSLTRSMDRLLDDVWRAEAAAASARFAPRLEVVESDGEFVVTAELPGLEEKDFHVEVHGKVVSLRGEKRS
jgi:HSP20 family molecular chaperone IbpA